MSLAMSQLSGALARAHASLLRIGGETVGYQPAGGVGDPLDLTVVWNDAEAQMPAGVRATAWFLDADLPNVGIAKGDVIQRGAFTYSIVDPADPRGSKVCQRDGNGGVTIFLKQKAHAPDA